MKKEDLVDVAVVLVACVLLAVILYGFAEAACHYVEAPVCR